jgi:hypothetical protein
MILKIVVGKKAKNIEDKNLNIGSGQIIFSNSKNKMEEFYSQIIPKTARSI